MSGNHCHIVAFDIPFPPSYGGAIDVYYKLEALYDAGVEVTLHCFFKGKPRNSAELEKLCRNVFYYPRKMSWRKAVGTTPFIIASRTSSALIRRLSDDDDPILLEGMHTASILRSRQLKDRRTLLRMHNLEWTYYNGLAEQESSLWKRLYFRAEASRLEHTATVLERASCILAISELELAELSRRSGRCRYLPPFHGHDRVVAPPGRGTFALYHGNLGVSENRYAAEYLAIEMFPGAGFPLKIAGSNAPPSWIEQLRRKAGDAVEIIEGPSDEVMEGLIRRAHIHVLPAVQPTGVKLKLIHALYCGRHCLVNQAMVQDSSLARLCHIAADTEAFREKIRTLVPLEFTAQEAAMRKELLESEFSDRKNADRLIRWIFPDRQ